MTIDSPRERSLFWGMIFKAILYGIELLLYTQTVWLLVMRPSAHPRAKLYCALGGIMLALVTVQSFSDFVFLEFIWIDHRDFPGGPLNYMKVHCAIWWQTLAMTAGQVTNFIGDGILLYRLYIIWGSNRLVMILPIMLYISSICIGLTAVTWSALPDGNFFIGKTINFEVPWISLSVSLNVVITALITYRLLRARKTLRSIMPEDTLKVYTGVIAILAESALPFSVLGIIFAITYGKRLDEGTTFSYIWGTYCALAPQFVIFRVATGRAWSRDIVTQTGRGRVGVISFSQNISPRISEKTATVSHPASSSTLKIGSSTMLSEVASHDTGSIV